MAVKKNDVPKDFTKFLDQAKMKIKKFGKEIGGLARKSEKEVETQKNFVITSTSFLLKAEIIDVLLVEQGESLIDNFPE